MDRLAAMKMFVRVVETGSFSAVARELNSTQPTVSKNIAELESWLGVRLLNRSTRSLRLTETGADYYERAVGILQDVEEAEQMAGELQTSPKGTVRISTMVAFGRLHVLPRLGEFFARYPDIRIDARFNDRVVDLLEEGIDVALRMGNLSDSTLVAKKLCSSPVVTVAAPSYLKHNGTPAHPRDLRDHNYISWSDGDQSAEVQFIEDDKPFRVRVDGNLVTNNSEALRAAVINGLGVSRMPRWLVGDAIENGDLTVVLDGFEPEPMPIHAVYLPGRHLPSRVRTLIDYLAEAFRQCPNICGEDCHPLAEQVKEAAG